MVLFFTTFLCLTDEYFIKVLLLWFFKFLMSICIRGYKKSLYSEDSITSRSKISGLFRLTDGGREGLEVLITSDYP